MQIKNLFERDVLRPINGVVRADQLDDDSVWQELDEFVVTKELDQHFRRFFSDYCDGLDAKHDPRIGVWVSGFFGSGKSHFIRYCPTCSGTGPTRMMARARKLSSSSRAR